MIFGQSRDRVSQLGDSFALADARSYALVFGNAHCVEYRTDAFASGRACDFVGFCNRHEYRDASLQQEITHSYVIW